MLVFALSIAGISLSIQRIAAERDRADERARVASTVLAFLEDDLLAAADPGAMPGHEMTVRQALDRAERQVGTRFAQAPVRGASFPPSRPLASTGRRVRAASSRGDGAVPMRRDALACVP